MNDGYTLTNGDLYVWKGGDSAGSTATIVEYLIVAGGGAGGYGGGGGGGVLTTSGYVVAAGSPVSLSVGDGGVGANGGNSTFASFTAIGGGRGGSSGAGAGAAGGSGGGAGYDYGNAAAGGGAGTAGQGNRGGHGSSGAGDASAGGGGGAGAVGTGGYANGTNLASGSTGAGGGAGGIGLLSSISGTPTYYGGGGGGGGNINGANIGNAAPGGLGGGGNGATTAGMPNQAGTDGTANTGGGGGGGDPEVGSANFKRGGSGIVIIRYADTYPVPSATTGSPTSVTTSGYRIYSWTTVGSGSITFANSSPVTGQGWVLVGNIKGIPGEYAAIGYTGSAGTNGYTGSAGSTGTQGNVGFTGSAGSTGTQGNSGFTGSAGIGFTGYSGSAGFTGSAGIGFTGYSGSAGFTGSAGVGYTGSAGSTGTQGNTGFTGSIGSTGTQGTVGYTGSVGAGYTGSTGYTGSKGESSFTWGDTLPSSPVVGDRWYDTSNSKLVVYVNDGDSTQWVEVAASGFLGQSGYTGSAGAGSTGPKITSVTVTDSSYNNLNDTAVALTGGYIKIAGSGFESGCQVLLGTTLATSVSYISSTEVRAQLPAASTGTYIIYLVNSDGGTAIRVNAVTFSPTPSWTTGAELSGASDTAISIQLAATDATSYSVAAGSSLPSGITLSSGGLLSGTITGLSADTAYNFTIVATDAELQDSTRAFTFTISIGDTYFKYVSMLLAGNGTNLAQNNTFIDSSTNNFSITRSGNVAQGTFSPYGVNWGVNFNTQGQYLTFGTSSTLALGAGSFTVELWLNLTAYKASTSTLIDWRTAGNAGTNNPSFSIGASGILDVYLNISSGIAVSASSAIPLNTWIHIACVRNGTALTLYFNGVSVGTGTSAINCSIETFRVNDTQGSYYTNCSISNLRIVKGTAVYTSAFTPSTTPLTAIANTVLLTCQSNRFNDNSTNNFTVTVGGSPTVQRFSPFSPSAVYSTGTIGGSGYFDGNGDYLTISDSNLALNTGDFTVECWINAPSGLTDKSIFEGRTGGTGTAGFTLTAISPTSIRIFSGGILITSGSINYVNTWCHVAVVRLSGTTTLYINGVSQGTTASLGNLTDSSFVIGAGKYASPPSVDAFFTGYISNFRMVKGTAVYTSSFTPPTAPVTAISGTSLLLNYTNAGVIDNSMMNNLETVGDAKITTALSKFGSGSMYFGGSGNYLNGSNLLAIQGSEPFTLEAWIYPTTVAGDCCIYETRSNGGTNGFVFFINSTGKLQVYDSVGTLQTQSSVTLTANTWAHIVLTRVTGSTVTYYVNGTAAGTFTLASFATASRTRIGAREDTAAAFIGYIDDFRITKGYARYTTTFTPPTSAHPLK